MNEVDFIDDKSHVTVLENAEWDVLYLRKYLL